MSKIGVLFGSFNPVHNGHLIAGNWLVENTDLDQVLFSLTPSNRFKDANSYWLYEDRRLLLEKSLEDSYNCKNLSYSTFEEQLKPPYYTVDSLDYLNSLPLYKGHNICLIIGADEFLLIDEWLNSDRLKRTYPIYVVPRIGYTIDKQKIRLFEYKELHIIDEKDGYPLNNISSSFIRKELRKGHNISYYVPTKEYEAIIDNNMYVSEGE